MQVIEKKIIRIWFEKKNEKSQMGSYTEKNIDYTKVDPSTTLPLEIKWLLLKPRYVASSTNTVDVNCCRIVKDV